MRPMNAGDGVRYFFESVVAGDGDRDLSTPLTRYYTEKGCPPGQWIGSGVASLDSPLSVGDTVTERQFQLLIGEGRHPVRAELLGKAYPKYAGVSERIDRRVKALNPALSDTECAQALVEIERDDTERGTRRAVAGFDYTFSVPKSVSVLWGVSDGGTQALIALAHHDAVADVIRLMEAQVVATCAGIDQGGGAVVQSDVTGIVATAFDHYDSRAGDPQLHTHVVVANRVRTLADGKWRTIDSRPMHAAIVIISALHNAVLADRLTRVLGGGWDALEHGRQNLVWEITGVGGEMISEFSSRTRDIDAEMDRLTDAYRAEHGLQPSRRMMLQLRQQATLATRPPKQMHLLAELTDEWRRWNLHAEASRQTMAWRFATAADREALTDQIVDSAEARSVRLTPVQMSVPAEFQHPDGTSRFRPRNMAVYSSQDLFDAETRLAGLAESFVAPVVSFGTVSRIVARPNAQGRALGPDQSDAINRIATSGRVIDVLVGPAGAGKTTSLASLRAAWETEHGAGLVVGLAPSATAAAVLGEDLGIPTENTARWLALHNHTGLEFHQGQLVIVDEASLAGTFTLDRIAGLADQAGAKVVLVGDWAQLQAVDAGGAFTMLVANRADPPELSDIHRFTNPWEKTASLMLRHADPAAIDQYDAHERLADGELDQVTAEAYEAWRDDTRRGVPSLLVADALATVQQLNAQARHDRILAGQVAPDREIALGDGSRTSAGDVVITRLNNRHL